MEEPGGLQSMGSLSWTLLSDFTFTFQCHALEKEMATHSGVFAWRIPGMGEPGGLPFAQRFTRLQWLSSSMSILWHCLSLGLEWKLTCSSPVAAAEFSKFAGIMMMHKRAISSNVRAQRKLCKEVTFNMRIECWKDSFLFFAQKEALWPRD